MLFILGLDVACVLWEAPEELEVWVVVTGEEARAFGDGPGHYGAVRLEDTVYQGWRALGDCHSNGQSMVADVCMGVEGRVAIYRTNDFRACPCDWDEIACVFNRLSHGRGVDVNTSFQIAGERLETGFPGMVFFCGKGGTEVREDGASGDIVRGDHVYGACG